MDIKVTTVILQSILQMFCIGLAFKAWNNRGSNGTRTFWWWFMGGFSLQLARRLLYLLVIIHPEIPDLKFFTWVIVPTGVSICFAIAMIKVFIYNNKKERELNDAQQRLRELTHRL